MTKTIRRRDALLLASLAGFCPPALAQDNPLVQRGVPAEATAENAVQARERAFASARRIAWQRLQAQTGGTAPTPSDAALDSMVAGVIVEEERTTPTRYVGRLTVQFASGTAGLARPGGAAGGLNVAAPVVATMDAAAQFAGLREWLELRRRLDGAGAVSGYDIVAISVDAARLRLLLSAPPGDVAPLLANAGVWVDANGPSWRIGLAGGR